MKKITLTALFFLTVWGTCLAWQNPIKPLSVGETMPNLSLKIYLGDSSYSKSLSEMKGKVVILDFWGVTCATCITTMPEVEELQKKCKDKLEILLVTKDSHDEINKLWAKLKGHVHNEVLEAGKNLLFVTSDTIIDKLFPHDSYGLNVWVDKNSVFRSIAYDVTTTPQNIEKCWENKDVAFANYELPDIKDKNLKLWFDQRIGFQDHLLSYSFFSKFDAKALVGGRSFFVETDPSSGRKVAINCINKSIVELYRIAYFNNENPTQNYITVESDNKSKYFRPIDGAIIDWREKFSYCYAARIRPEDNYDIFQLMRHNLDAFFHTKSKIETRPVECYVLRPIKAINENIKGSFNESHFDIVVDGDKKKLIAHKVAISNLFQAIEGEYIFKDSHPIPFINSFKKDINIDIEIPWGENNFSIPVLNKQLKKYGLEVAKVTRVMNLLVIRE